MLDFQAARWLIDKEVAEQAGNDHPTSIPTGVFKTTDGHINIATTGGTIWERFCEAIGAPEHADENPDYATGGDALEEPRRAQRGDRQPHREATPAPTGSSMLNEAGVPCGPIYSIDQMFADPQVQHLGIAQPT